MCIRDRVEATPAAIASFLKYDFIQKIELVKKLKRDPEPQAPVTLANPQVEALIKQTANPLSLDYGNSFTQNNQIKIPAAHELGYSGSDVVIAVIDTGFNRLSHENLIKWRLLALGILLMMIMMSEMAQTWEPALTGPIRSVSWEDIAQVN